MSVELHHANARVVTDRQTDLDAATTITHLGMHVSRINKISGHACKCKGLTRYLVEVFAAVRNINYQCTMVPVQWLGAGLKLQHHYFKWSLMYHTPIAMVRFSILLFFQTL